MQLDFLFGPTGCPIYYFTHLRACRVAGRNYNLNGPKVALGFGIAVDYFACVEIISCTIIIVYTQPNISQFCNL